MKKLYVLFAVLAVALLVSGCLKVPKVPAAAKKLVDAVQTDDTNTDTTADTVQKQCEEAINYQVLIDALPTSVNGFVAGEPEGNMLTFTDPSTQKVMKYSTANVRLEKGDDDIQVTLMDTCYINYLSMSWAGFYESEGTDGFFKKTTVSGYQGWHQYDKSSERYTFNIFVEDRVIVTVEGSNGVADADVEAAAKDIDFAAIKAKV